MTLEQYIQNLNLSICTEFTSDLVSTCIPDLNHESIGEFAKKIGLDYVQKKENGNVCFANNNDELRDDFKQVFSTVDFLDYIYAVSFSADYKEKFQKTFSIDFSRLPFPKVSTAFWKLVKLGTQLRELHLIEIKNLESSVGKFAVDGTNIITDVKFKLINTTPACSHPSKGGEFQQRYSPPSEGCAPKADGVVFSSATSEVANNATLPHFTIKNIKIYHNTITTLPYNPKLKDRAKALRYAENLSEVLFWMQVHKGQFYKIDFDRQRIIGNYIVDFYVKKLGLIIEIDGASHEGKEKYDAEREKYLKSLKLKIFRIPVVDVLQNMSKAMTDLEKFIVENYQEVDCVDLERPPRPPQMGIPREEGNYMEGNCNHDNLGCVFINDNQYFKSIPESVWNLFIGNSQQAQKWLLDRNGQKLESKDIKQYQKIITALIEVNRIIKEINKIEIQ